MARLARSIASFLRLTRWRVWCRSKGSLFLSCMYFAALTRARGAGSVVREMGGLLLVFCALACYGHLVNSLSDLAVDQAAGKPSPLAAQPPHAARRLVFACGATGVLLTCLLYHERRADLFLWWSAFALATAYSLPPLRLKERGVLGLVSAAVAQRTLPAAIVFHEMRAWSWAAGGLCVLGTLIGFRAILWHQLQDRLADSLTGVRTFVIRTGEARARRFMERVVFPLELAALVMTLALMSLREPITAVVPLGLVAWTVAQVAKRRDRALHPMRVFSHVLDEFYDQGLPLLLSLVILQRQSGLWVVPVFTGVWLYYAELTRTARRIVRASHGWLLRWHTVSDVGS